MRNTKTWHQELWELAGPTSDAEVTAQIPQLPARANGSQLPSETLSRARVKRINRYLKHQFSRLEKHRDNPTNYWTISHYLIRRSDGYLIWALNKSAAGWWRSLSWRETLKLIEEVKRRLRSFVPNIKMKRVYIPKADGKRMRPLGVPELPDRIILTLFTKLLEYQLIRYTSPQQHLFVPGRGLHTIWQQIIDNIDEVDNIFQYDLKGFFNSIDLRWLQWVLYKLGLRGWALHWVHLANHSLFKKWSSEKEIDILADVEATPWSVDSIRPPSILEYPNLIWDNARQRFWKPTKVSPELRKALRSFKNLSKLIGEQIYSRLFIEKISNIGNDLSTIRFPLELVPEISSKKLRKKLKHGPRGNHASSKKGIPQGVPWSPLLSTIVLPFSGVFNLKGVAAADDGLWWWKGKSMEDPTLTVLEDPDYKWNLPAEEEGDLTPAFKKSGIEFSTKEGVNSYVKKDGKWLGNLHFAGSILDPFNRTLNGIPLVELTPEKLKKTTGRTWLTSWDLTSGESKQKERLELLIEQGKIEKAAKSYDMSKLEDYRTTRSIPTHVDSWLMSVKDAVQWGMPTNFAKSNQWRLYITGANEKKFAYASLTDKSAICAEQLAEVLRTKKELRSKSLLWNQVPLEECEPILPGIGKKEYSRQKDTKLEQEEKPWNVDTNIAAPRMKTERFNLKTRVWEPIIPIRWDEDAYGPNVVVLKEPYQENKESVGSEQEKTTSPIQETEEEAPELVLNWRHEHSFPQSKPEYTWTKWGIGLKMSDRAWKQIYAFRHAAKNDYKKMAFFIWAWLRRIKWNIIEAAQKISKWKNQGQYFSPNYPRGKDIIKIIQSKIRDFIHGALIMFLIILFLTSTNNPAGYVYDHNVGSDRQHDTGQTLIFILTTGALILSICAFWAYVNNMPLPDLSEIADRLKEMEHFERNSILVASGVDDPRLR